MACQQIIPTLFQLILLSNGYEVREYRLLIH